MKKSLLYVVGGMALGVALTVSTPVLAGNIQLSDVYDKVKSVLTNTKTIKNNQATLNDNDIALREDHQEIYDLLLYADYNAYIACYWTAYDPTDCLDSGVAPSASNSELSARVQAFRDEHGLTVPAQQ